MKFILKAQASSTVSRLSAPRSSTKLASSVRSMPRFLAITARRRVRDLQGRVIDEINPNIVRAKDLWCCWYSILGSGKGHKGYEDDGAHPRLAARWPMAPDQGRR